MLPVPARHAAPPLRRVPAHLGLHALHRHDLLHHAVPLSRPGVGDPQLHAGGMAPHPHHGHLQPL